MSKQFKPVMGMPVDDFLVRMVADVKEDHENNPSTGPRMGRSVREVESIAESVRRSLNTGTCMNESQAAEVKNSILFDRRADAKVVKELIDRVNGFRLECRDCLRADCGQRDLEGPLPMLLEREKGKLCHLSRCANLGISEKMRHVLASAGIHTIGDLCERSEDELLSIKGIGSGNLKRIKKILTQEFLLKLKD